MRLAGGTTPRPFEQPGGDIRVDGRRPAQQQRRTPDAEPRCRERLGLAQRLRAQRSEQARRRGDRVVERGGRGHRGSGDLQPRDCYIAAPMGTAAPPAPSAQPPAAALLPRVGANFAELLDATTRLFRATLPACLPLALLAVMVGQLPAAWLAAGGAPAARPAAWWPLASAAGLLNLWLWNLLLLRQAALARGTPMALGAAAGIALRRLPGSVAVLLGVVALSAAGLLLLVLPGVYLLFACAAAWPLQVLDGEPPAAAIDRSLRLVRGRWQRTAALCGTGLFVVFASYGAGYVLGLLIATVLGGGGGLALPSRIAGGLIGALFMPFMTALAIVLHADLRARAPVAAQPSSASSSD
ncbi:MAG: hypothetical protein U1F11_04435 [Steroidobacteraceae bacterium]